MIMHKKIRAQKQLTKLKVIWIHMRLLYSKYLLNFARQRCEAADVANPGSRNRQ